MFKKMTDYFRERIKARAKKDAYVKIRADLTGWGYAAAATATDEQLVDMCDQIGRALRKCKSGLQLRNLRRRVEQGTFKFTE